MKLIAGLGNPGTKYTTTRHNLGFMVLDHLGANLGSFSDGKHQAQVLKTELAGEQVILAKPQTFMNLSGQSLQQLAHFYKIAPSDIWVVHDDIDLEFGKLRVRQGGGSGGHNGLKSIIASLGDNFGRFRIGVANAQLRQQIDPEDFVLQAFTSEEAKQLDLIVAKTAEQIVGHLESGELTDQSYHLI